MLLVLIVTEVGGEVKGMCNLGAYVQFGDRPKLHGAGRGQAQIARCRIGTAGPKSHIHSTNVIQWEKIDSYKRKDSET